MEKKCFHKELVFLRITLGSNADVRLLGGFFAQKYNMVLVLGYGFGVGLIGFSSKSIGYWYKTNTLATKSSPAVIVDILLKQFIVA